MLLSSYHTSNNKFKFYILKQNNSIVYPNDKGHVALKHEDVFKIKVNNPLPVRMQIDVYLNGKVGDDKAFIGSWILFPFQEATLETYKTSGGVALSGSSNQQFGTTNKITRYGDVNVIYDVRLVENKITSLHTVPKHNYSV